MSGSLLAALDNNIIRVFDTSNNNAQVGSDISVSPNPEWSDIAMSGPLVSAISNSFPDRIQVFDTRNGEQIGEDISLGTGVWLYVAMSGLLVAGLNNSGTIKVFDIGKNNEQVGSTISLGSGNWQGVSMIGPFVTAIDNTNDRLRVYDTSDNNNRVSSISVGTADWQDTAMGAS